MFKIWQNIEIWSKTRCAEPDRPKWGQFAPGPAGLKSELPPRPVHQEPWDYTTEDQGPFIIMSNQHLTWSFLFTFNLLDSLLLHWDYLFWHVGFNLKKYILPLQLHLWTGGVADLNPAVSFPGTWSYRYLFHMNIWLDCWVSSVTF